MAIEAITTNQRRSIDHFKILFNITPEGKI
jgi:hypothetical protein